MMSHFNVKSLIFYGTAIGSVVTLFAIVTAYGEANLTASKPISGNYSVQLPTLAKCGPGNPINLSIQQSGIYVAAALSNPQVTKEDHDKKSSKAMTLNGHWNNQQLVLEGLVPTHVLCKASQQHPQTSMVDSKIQGSFRQSTFTGTLVLGTVGHSPFGTTPSAPIQITAHKQVE